MKYLELSKEKYEELAKLCLVRHISDSGTKRDLMSKLEYLTKSGETFATNLNERLVYRNVNSDVDDDNLYNWEYDLVVVPFIRVNDVKRILSKDKKLELK